jgi:serine/threonine protein kinase
MSISPNTLIGHYTIISKVGEGGMGEVWRARDSKLGRDVAIKVLPAEYSGNKGRLARFEQEAQAAGALNHPNILVIHHIGMHDGAPYIVSEMLEGESLREHLADGPLPQRKALDYGLQLARGLAAAHEKGIVHRDIKPENVFITDDGRVKILDFGLAKLTVAVDGPQTEVPTRKVNTSPGTVMGTVGYMSPEQLKGQTADQRSDIFSCGAILYEMIFGRRAFQRDSTAETMSAILHEDPPELSELNKAVSPALERVVRHCLEKNPAQRFYSARDLAFAIESLSDIPYRPNDEPEYGTETTSKPSSSTTSEFRIPTKTTLSRRELAVIGTAIVAAITAILVISYRTKIVSPPIQSIAVMPFVDDGGNADVEYLCDGMTETLISSLSQLPNLNVKARSSVFRYKGKATDAKTIGTELGVQAVLNGHVLQRGDQLTLSLELVNAETENVIWSER